VNDRYLPTPEPKPQYHPDSYQESQAVVEAMKNPDMEYFLLTDESPRAAYIQYLENHNLEYDPEKLAEIIKDSFPLVMAHKTYYNRPRPAQVNSQITPEPSETAKTPAYPSGHTFQSYLIAQHLSKKYPRHTLSFYRIARRIAHARVSVGLHYPSDNAKAFHLAHSL
jgi:hypothetical protein